MTALESRPEPRLRDLLVTWLKIGIQSFGGGSTTLYLIHQACIEQEWFTEPEFAKAWALVQISPGINLVKLAVVLGYQLRRWPGVLVVLAGLLLPSATITAAMTAAFVVVRDWPWVQAVLRGLAPATIGLSLSLAIQMAQSPLKLARREGPSSIIVHLALLTGSALLLAAAQVSPVLILVLAGMVALLLLGILQAHSGRAAGRSPQ